MRSSAVEKKFREKESEWKKRLQEMDQKLKSITKEFEEAVWKLEKTTNELKKMKEVHSHVESILTPNQLKTITGMKKVFWNAVEISSAITLRYLSIRAYIYVKEKMKIPLPGKFLFDT